MRDFDTNALVGGLVRRFKRAKPTVLMDEKSNTHVRLYG